MIQARHLNIIAVSGTTNTNGLLVSTIPASRKILSVASPAGIGVFPFVNGSGAYWVFMLVEPVGWSKIANTATSFSVMAV